MIKTSKEIARLAASHGISKDVIDLFEKKVSLLEGELEEFKAREKEKDIKISKLEKQISEISPVGGFKPDIIKLLKLFFENGEMSEKYVLSKIEMNQGMLGFHFGELLENRLIRQSRISPFDTGKFRITQSGRQFLVKNNLV